MDRPHVSVIIPAFNEQERIEKTLDRISSYLGTARYASEILVVDNRSTDNTPQIVKQFAQFVPNLRLLDGGRIQGKGYAVAMGMLESSGQYALFSDADLSAPIEELDKLLCHVENGADIAIGSRGLKTSNILLHQPWFRRTTGKLFNLFVQAIVLHGVKDTQCGFKCFRRETIQPIFRRQRISGYGFDFELLFIARKHGYRIVEVPIRWADDPRSHVQPLRDGYRMLKDLLRIRLDDVRGAYD